MPWKRSLNSLAMLMLMSSSIANAQSADSFKTAEYNETGYNVLDAVNAASAYANGYTGKGVIVGVCDDPINFFVPEFDLKQNSEMINVAGAGVYNWANFTHGTHVAGVVAASKNGLGMHGIAFDAEIKGSTAGRIYYSDGSFESRKDLYVYYVQHPEIKVINNSWGTGCYLTNIDDNQAYELLQSGVLTPTGNPEWQDYLYNNTIQFREAVAHDKLLVWAAGNNGHTMASIENTSPVFDRSLSNNFITVTAGDAAALHRNKTGGFDADCNAIAIFSDLAQYREDCVLNAPGVAIGSANADFAAAGQMDVIRYGTSQAAPLVTGVGALVQQAFPYLGGNR
jgi:subtilase-type serine protease